MARKLASSSAGCIGCSTGISPAGFSLPRTSASRCSCSSRSRCFLHGLATPAKKNGQPLAAARFYTLAFESVSARDRRLRSEILCREFEPHLAFVVDIDEHFSAACEATEEQLVSEPAPDGVLNQPRHRSRAHERIETVLGQVVLESLRETCLHLLLV